MTEINVDFPNNYFLQIDYFKNESIVAAGTQRQRFNPILFLHLMRKYSKHHQIDTKYMKQ